MYIPSVFLKISQEKTTTFDSYSRISISQFFWNCGIGYTGPSCGGITNEEKQISHLRRVLQRWGIEFSPPGDGCHGDHK